MGRSTIADLDRILRPINGNSINAEPYIETAEEAATEELRRRLGIYNYRNRQLSEPDRLSVETLLHKLSSPRTPDQRGLSPASALDIRDWRIPAVEQTWAKVIESGPERCYTATAIPPSWILTPEQFAASKASTFKERFRSLLNRHGAARADGWLLAKLDVEFDTHNQLFRAHYHILACGEMVNVVNSLRASPVLRPQRTPAIDGRRVARPLHIDHRTLTDLPMPLSYVLKGHFSARWLGLNANGEVKRGSRPIRIPEPFGTQTLLWLDQQQLSGLVLMIGLKVIDRQLVIRP